MVDFKKHIAKADVKAPVNPVELYSTLDRASDKGPLRDAQNAVLNDWFIHRRNDRDVIVKLHTGQGKTLIGLLILQSKLNEGVGPAVYLCPNNFLVAQTATQAKQFGFKCVLADPELPGAFLDGTSILITSVQKMFNGLTKFRLGLQSEPIGSLVMDDAHACIDAIKGQCMIRLKKETQPYSDLLNLFSTALEAQGLGTYADIKNNSRDAFLPVPYWDWMEKRSEVTGILSKHLSMDEIKFAWPLLRDSIHNCLCVMSGVDLEIVPYLAPMDAFGSYSEAKHRVFMSATVTNDSFLVKGLGLKEDVINKPIVYSKESWSGEKMILIPSSISDSLTREYLVQNLSKPVTNRAHGVVVLAPSAYGCQDWGKYGAVITDKNTITPTVGKLLKGDRDNVVVIVNRYDGIDLPDDACRILILDSKPHSDSLVDRYIENCRSTSDAIATKTARIIEQGLGRSVRGEKDYCVFILVGASLVKALRTQGAREFFSHQTRMQIEIGLKIAEFAKEEIASGTEPGKALWTLMNQCLNRDTAWKEYYVEQMNTVGTTLEEPKMVHVFAAELEAEGIYQRGDCDKAVARIQKLLDEHIRDENDRGWYLQEMARYAYPKSVSESNDIQIAAHRMNRYLFRPKHGMQVQRIGTVVQKRLERINKWISSFATFEELRLALDEILNDFQFGKKADSFERAVDRLAPALGFDGQRPDKEWKEGPDNLWAVRDNEYLLVECKSEVDLKRSEINKAETGQMNNAMAWFTRHYPGTKSTNIMIVPTKTVGHAGGFNGPVKIMRNSNLKKLAGNVEKFFREFAKYDLGALSESKIDELLAIHQLAIDNILHDYVDEPKNL